MGKLVFLRRCLVLPFFIVYLLSFSEKATAQFYDLEIYIPDMETFDHSDSVVIPVYMKNYADSIAGFKFTVLIDQPGTMQFFGFDTAGTLISGWEMVQTAYAGNNIQILAMANLVPPPMVYGIDYPQTGQIPLIKLLASIDTLLDTAGQDYIDTDFLFDKYYFNFSDQDGNSIGLSYYPPTIDTIWYDCLEWIEDPPDDSVCLRWGEVPDPPADTFTVDTILNPYLDSTIVKVRGGKIFLSESCMNIGDINCDGIMNLLDITYLLNYIYRNGLPPCRPDHGDVNCNCATNLLDITCMINKLYRGGTCVICTCEGEQLNCHK